MYVCLPNNFHVPIYLPNNFHVHLFTKQYCGTFVYVTMFCCRDIASPRSQVRVNLTCALLAGQIVFLAGISATANYVSNMDHLECRRTENYKQRKREIERQKERERERERERESKFHSISQ